MQSHSVAVAVFESKVWETTEAVTSTQCMPPTPRAISFIFHSHTLKIIQCSHNLCWSRCFWYITEQNGSWSSTLILTPSSQMRRCNKNLKYLHNSQPKTVNHCNWMSAWKLQILICCHAWRENVLARKRSHCIKCWKCNRFGFEKKKKSFLHFVG